MAFLRQCLEQVRAKRASCQGANSGLPPAIAAEGAAPPLRPFLSLEPALISESGIFSLQEKRVVITGAGAGDIVRDIALTALPRWRIACLVRGAYLGRTVRATVTVSELLVRTMPRGAQHRLHRGRTIVVDGEASVMPTSRADRA